VFYLVERDQLDRPVVIAATLDRDLFPRAYTESELRRLKGGAQAAMEWRSGDGSHFDSYIRWCQEQASEWDAGFVGQQWHEHVAALTEPGS
jgi:hypothetical protein